ncbi:hypothetical protein EVAR_60949_1 [Eumeta japonica]|uniref:Reverse transcriptase domain-containing protein n=1 Tax=Eumeta variegata TaxID=151549 RepID=A0A4C1XV79_EUMVA|nr:hypothetical protein EVAR_60949_1 [Eumeta japonica]
MHRVRVRNRASVGATVARRAYSPAPYLCMRIDATRLFGAEIVLGNRMKRNDLLRTLSIRGVSNGNPLLTPRMDSACINIQALQSLYKSLSVCVRINGAYTDWFDIHRGVRQGCVASPWLSNLFMDSRL